MTKNYLILGIVMLSLMALAPYASAGSCCSVGNWEASAQAFLSDADAGGQITSNDQAQSEDNNSGIASSSTANSGIADSGLAAKEPAQRSDAFPNGESLVSMKSVSSSHLVLDISNADSYTASHIKNAVLLPWQSFLDGNGALKTEEEMATVLGEAGVFQNDSVVLYGSPESLGEVQLVFWALSYLGVADVKVLDGSLEDWKAAGLPVESSEKKRPAVEYKPAVKSELLADYEYVKSGQAQILDVRPFVEFGKGRIPGSVALDPSNLIKGDRIKDAETLKAIFERLDKDKPVVVYSDDYKRSALVWYALKLMGYNASIYTWVDWEAHESEDTAREVTSVANNETSAAGGEAAGSKYTRLGTT
jgi:thiosulfate/3-mercaptopyruvate sulfurtransferase